MNEWISCDAGPTKLRYTWHNRSVEVQAETLLGEPRAEVVQPSETPGTGFLLHIEFDSSSGPTRLRLPLPQSLDDAALTEGKVLVRSTAEERRIDPDDGELWTLRQLKRKYAGWWPADEINTYWLNECKPMRLASKPQSAWTSWKVMFSSRSAAVLKCPPAADKARTSSGTALDMLDVQATGLAEHLSSHGWGVIDGFLCGSEADDLYEGMKSLWQLDVLGSDRQLFAARHERGDLHYICRAPNVLPKTLELAQERIERVVGKLGDLIADLGSTARCMPALLAVYPGGGTRYIRHFDAVRSGEIEYEKRYRRACTLILYMNPSWSDEHGGQLRIWPESNQEDLAMAHLGLSPEDEVSVTIDPLHGRLVAFLCENRNAHEVLPAWQPRFAASWGVERWC